MWLGSTTHTLPAEAGRNASGIAQTEVYINDSNDTQNFAAQVLTQSSQRHSIMMLTQRLFLRTPPRRSKAIHRRVFHIHPPHRSEVVKHSTKITEIVDNQEDLNHKFTTLVKA